MCVRVHGGQIQGNGKIIGNFSFSGSTNIADLCTHTAHLPPNTQTHMFSFMSANVPDHATQPCAIEAASLGQEAAPHPSRVKLLPSYVATPIKVRIRTSAGDTRGTVPLLASDVASVDGPPGASDAPAEAPPPIIFLFLEKAGG